MTKLSVSIQSLGVFVLLAVTSTLASAQETTREGLNLGDFEVGGFIDSYYQYDFNNPPIGSSLGNAGRLFDVQHNSFTVSAVRVNVRKPVSERNPVGLNVQLLFGPNADLLHAYEPGGVNRYQNIQQAYGTFRGGGQRPVQVDLGKFAAWIGYEGLDAVDNENYSRALNFNLGQPNYTAGLRVAKPLSDRVSATLYLANGFNETEDSNGGKTLGAQVGFAPQPNTNLLLGWWGGLEGSTTQNEAGGYGGINFAQPGTRRVNFVNLIATHQATARTRFAFDRYYADASSEGGNGGKWNGQAIYARHQLSGNTAAALRLERLEDSDGLRTGVGRQLHSITATYEYVVGSRGDLVNRLELRQDFSSTPYFIGDSGE
ncbi:MAG: hypothetical protein OHK0029_06320 [Armatimonadaceae bacterium]